MKFYEFNQYEYYALIGAKTEEEAVKYYSECIADIEDGEGPPNEITPERAKEKLLMICKDSNEEAEANRQFAEYSTWDEPYCVLIDSSLL